MNTPEPKPDPAPRPQPAAKKPVVVVKKFTARDLALTVIIAILVIGFIVMAILYSTRPPKNTLRGVVKGRYATGERETEFDVSRRGVKSKTVDTGYYLKVFVPEENRSYDVIVEKELWNTKKDGDTLDFLRPPDEQKY
jgi:hypothetical protein